MFERTKTTVMVTMGLLISTVSYAQQNIQFTQYIFNSIAVNPAYSGYKEQWFGQLGLRSQWTGLEGAPQTATVSVDGLLDVYGGKRHGFGVQLMRDKLGPQSANSAYVNYAFRLRLDREDMQRLSFGVGVGVTQYALNGAMLQPIDGRDQVIPQHQIHNFVPDVRFGIYYYNPYWYLGASVVDLLSGDQTENIFRWDRTTTDNIRRRRHIYIIAGALFDFKEGMMLRPSLLLKEDFRGPTSFDVNAMFIFGERFWIGGGWRTGMTVFQREYTRLSGNALSKQNSLSAVTQVYISPNLRIGYSYDYILSRVASIQNGSHEITLGVVFGRGYQRMLTPRFF